MILGPEQYHLILCGSQIKYVSYLQSPTVSIRESQLCNGIYLYICKYESLKFVRDLGIHVYLINIESIICEQNEWKLR